MGKQTRFGPAKRPGPQGGTVWQEDDVLHIDVRGLEPPEPMVAILALLDSDAIGTRITIHHHRDPLLLYPELDERGWTYRQIDSQPSEFRLLLTRSVP